MAVQRRRSIPATLRASLSRGLRGPRVESLPRPSRPGRTAGVSLSADATGIAPVIGSVSPLTRSRASRSGSVARAITGLTVTVALLSAAVGVTACSAADGAVVSPSSTSVPDDLAPNTDAVIHSPTTTTFLPATTATTATLLTITPQTATITSAIKGTEGSEGSTLVAPVTTYRNSTVTGRVTRLTAEDGGVFIVPADPTIELSSSMVVQITAPATLDVTGVDLAGAKAAYEGWTHFVGDSLIDPGTDWVAEIDKWAMDPARGLMLDQLKRWAQGGTHSEGYGSFFATVSKAAPDEVELEVCNDTSGVDIVKDAGGASVRSNDGFRHIQYVTINRNSSGRWLVSNVTGTAESTC